MNTNNETKSAEKLSAYIDDALTDSEIDALVADNSSSISNGFSEAARYQMIGDALRGELSDSSMLDVSAQVREALQNESFDAVKTATFASQTKSNFNLLNWLDGFFGSMTKPLAGMAVAASVAMVMVFTVAQTESDNDVQVLANQTESLPAINTPVVAEQQTTEFDRYLAEHAEFAGQDTIQGRIPYVRAVSYEAE